ncbi:MAG: hypothetical protein EOM74_00880 [Methanomicrobia archaeon]|nr:hypothetical protein [Methanomicrobia archaeon]
MDPIEFFHLRALRDFTTGVFDMVFVNLAVDDIEDKSFIDFITSEIRKFLICKTLTINVVKNTEEHEYVTLKDYLLPTLLLNQYDYIFYSHFKGLSWVVKEGVDEDMNYGVIASEMLWSYCMYRYDFGKPLLNALKTGDKCIYGLLDPNDKRFTQATGFKEKEGQGWATLWNNYIWKVVSKDRFENMHNLSDRFENGGDINFACLGSFQWINVKRYNSYLESNGVNRSDLSDFLTVLYISYKESHFYDLANNAIEYFLSGMLPLNEFYLPTTEYEYTLAEANVGYDYFNKLYLNGITEDSKPDFVKDFDKWLNRDVIPGVTSIRYLKDYEPYANAHIGDWTYAGEGFKIRSLTACPNITIGKYCSIGENCVINCMSNDMNRITAYPFYNVSDFYDYEVSTSDDYENHRAKDVTIGNSV